MLIRTLLPTVWLIVLALPMASAAAESSTTDFHVAADGPLATLTAARDAVRRLKAQGPLAQPVRIFVHGGTYRVTETMTLTDADSGSEKTPIVWQAAPGESVRLTGGAPLTQFKPVADPTIGARLDPAARSHVVAIDLKTAGLSNLGTVAGSGGPRAELICNQQYMTLARYPNRGQWAKIANVPQTGTTRHELEGIVHYGRFGYDDARPARWKDARDVWVHGYWVWDWSDQFHRVQKFDLAKKELYPEPPYHGYGYKTGQRYYYLNVLEELDQPGEWYLDRQTSILYFWPPCPVEKAEIAFPELQMPMLVLDHVHDVSLQGMIFECSRTTAVVLKGGTRDQIVGCTVRNVGDTAIDVQGGTHHTVRSCDIYEVAATGICLNGGDRQTLARGDHIVENCHIHHFARVLKTYRPAVQLAGVGHRISHCLIHDAPHEGIGYDGNDHVIEYCDISRIAQETGDVGATYAAADWTYMGHEFRYNYFHDIHGPGNLGCFTIYPDLPCGGIHLHGNVFYDVDQVFHTNSGRGMLIENNVFLRCRGMGFGTWPDAKKFQEGGDWGMVEKLKAVHYDQPPYSTRYPVLQHLAEDFSKGPQKIVEREIPKDNIIRRNISWGSQFLNVWAPANLNHFKIENNLLADEVLFIGCLDDKSTSKTYRNGDPAVAAELAKRGNILVHGNPGLGDPSKHDFNPTPNSPATKLGFQRIPFEKIGLQRDEFRKTLPVASSTK
jgi:hypothetical protein